MDDISLGEVTRNLEKLFNRIDDYIESNEIRMRTVENSVTELKASQKNFMWMFGIIITIISIASNITLRFI